MRTYLILILLLPIFVFTQEKQKQYSVDANYYYGSILPHSKKIQHLITDHPEGVFISVNRKTFGDKEWESRLNYPDYGVTLHYQNNKNETLGDLYGVFGHLSFYFLKRNLSLRIGQGVAYNTNPYDKEKNYRNVAFGTHFMPSTFFMLNYQKEDLWEGLGLRAGLFLIHHSNGRIKTPNTSANTVGANVGLHYTIDYKNKREYVPRNNKDSTYTEQVKYNLAFRTGVHESHILGSGQYPFYTFSVYADKRISRSSAFQAGLDMFLSMMYKHEIEMMATSFPEKGIGSDTDYERIGAFVGYELFLNRLSFEGQLGVYVYDDYKSDTFLYQHLGLKYYFYKNFFVGTGLKTHFSKAEAMEFTIGVRL
ncbi:MAG: acyloxyacyl hydrolase [Moheibacter sp.]